MNKFLLLGIIFSLLIVSYSYATCKLDSTGQVTGAACTIEQANKSDSKNNVDVENSKKPSLFKKESEVKKQNFEFDRGLLYRNINILWFNQ